MYVCCSCSFFAPRGGGGGEGCEASAETHSIIARLYLYMVRMSRDERIGEGREKRKKAGNVTCSLMCW